MTTTIARGTQELQAHPVAALFPMLADDDLQDLADSIKEQGLLHPIVLDNEGRILDGRNRYAACKMAGVEPAFITYECGDPDAYAVTVNIARRHMSKGQQAMVLARAGLFATNNQTGLAKSAGMSQSRLAKANTVLEHAPDLADDVVAGLVSLDEAYKDAQRRKVEATERRHTVAQAIKDYDDLKEQLANGEITQDEAFAEAVVLIQEAKQRDEDRKGQIARARERIQQLLTGWATLEGLDGHEYYDEIVAWLSPGDKATMDELIEANRVLRG